MQFTLSINPSALSTADAWLRQICDIDAPCFTASSLGRETLRRHSGAELTPKQRRCSRPEVPAVTFVFFGVKLERSAKKVTKVCVSQSSPLFDLAEAHALAPGLATLRRRGARMAATPTRGARRQPANLGEALETR